MGTKNVPQRTVRQLVGDLGLQLGFVAKKLGLSRYTCTQWVLNAGWTSPSIKRKLCLLLRVTPAELDAALEETDRLYSAASHGPKHEGPRVSRGEPNA